MSDSYMGPRLPLEAHIRLGMFCRGAQGSVPEPGRSGVVRTVPFFKVVRHPKWE